MALPVLFLSDFGLEDEFVGVVHGVVATLSPDSRVIDVTHGIPRGDIMAGALALGRAVQYLPRGVVLAVVDPGVGSDRQAVAIGGPGGLFVGPDNGVLSAAVALTGGATEAHLISNPELVIPSEGSTFAGRDIFAPAAASLASGEVSISDLGPALDPATLTPMMLPLPDLGDTAVTGVVWWIDGFGNAQTNVSPSDLAGIGISQGQDVSVLIGAESRILPWVSAYADVEKAHELLHVDSAGLMALAVRDGHLADSWGLHVHRTVTFSRALSVPATPLRPPRSRSAE